MENVDYAKDGNSVLMGKDGVAIIKHITGIVGGRACDLTAINSEYDKFDKEVIEVGTPIITNGSGVYKPLIAKNYDTGAGTELDPTVHNYGFGTLPTGFSYCGLAAATCKADKAIPIITAGVVNKKVITDVQYGITAPDPSTLTLDWSAVINALPLIQFVEEEAYPTGA